MKHLKDKKLRLFQSRLQIKKLVKSIAEQINRDYDEPVLLVSVLNGSFMFTADLMRELKIPCEVCFVRLSSYDADKSTGKVCEILELDRDITGKNVIIVEDLVDTGETLRYLMKEIQSKEPKSLEICALFSKPSNELKIEYLGMDIPDKFIVGYGMDYCDAGRELDEVYVFDDI